MIVRDFDKIEREAANLPGMEGVATQAAFAEHEALPGFLVRMFTLQPGGHTALHWHRQQHLHYVLAGEGYVVGKDDEKIPIRSGEVVLVPSNDPHMIVNTSQDQELRFFDVAGPCGYDPNTTEPTD